VPLTREELEERIAASKGSPTFAPGPPDEPFGQEDYMRLLLKPCDYCDEATQYNYIEPIDESKPIGHRNSMSVCIPCKELKGNRPKAEFRDEVKARVKARRNR